MFSMNRHDIPPHLLEYFRPRSVLKPKDDAGIPHKVVEALRDDGWYLRSDIIWGKGLSFCEKEIKCPHCGGKHKFNYAGSAMPESVTDRPTKGHEYMFLLSKGKKYYYDKWAVAEPITTKAQRRHTKEAISDKGRMTSHRNPSMSYRYDGVPPGNPAGRNLRSVWAINPGNFQMEMCGACKHVYTKKEYKRLEKNGKNRVCKCGESGAWLSHFATFPPALVEPCIKAGTSQSGACPTCGAAWERVVEKPDMSERPTRTEGSKMNTDAVHLSNNWQDYPKSAGQAYQNWRNANPDVTTDWRPTCECLVHSGGPYGGPDDVGELCGEPPDPIPCRVLDPFWGIGTTSLVSERLGRDSVGIELNPDYAIMGKAYIEGECPMFAKVEIINGT